jgi:hypothetical protein
MRADIREADFVSAQFGVKPFDPAAPFGNSCESPLVTRRALFGPSLTTFIPSLLRTPDSQP